MADAQVPWGVDALGGAITEPAWWSKPSWYLLVTDDRMIPPSAQRAMAERTGETVSEVPGSHAIYVSNPAAVAAVVAQAAATLALSPRLRLIVLASAAIAEPETDTAALEYAITEPGNDRWPFDLARIQLAYGAAIPTRRSRPGCSSPRGRSPPTSTRCFRNWGSRRGPRSGTRLATRRRRPSDSGRPALAADMAFPSPGRRKRHISPA